MRIGIDIDNVLANYNEELLRNYLIHDKKLRNTGIVDSNMYISKGMFDWTKEEKEQFFNENIDNIVLNLKPIGNCKEIIDKLKNDGNDIYIVTGRKNRDYKDPINMTLNWLKRYNINYDKIVFTDSYDKMSKAVECKNHNIDIMIEDDPRICKNLKDNNINLFIMETEYNRECTEYERVYNWDDIYNKIKCMY